MQKGKVTVYRATEGAQVTLHEPSKAGELIAKGLAAGATGVSGPSFTVGNEEEAFAKVLAAAFDKAKERAAVLAAQAGRETRPGDHDRRRRRRRTRRARNSRRPKSGSAGTAGKAAPTPPTKPGTSQVKATVHVIFELL